MLDEERLSLIHLSSNGLHLKQAGHYVIPILKSVTILSGNSHLCSL